jgi:hypothetical protein
MSHPGVPPGHLDQLRVGISARGYARMFCTRLATRMLCARLVVTSTPYGIRDDACPLRAIHIIAGRRAVFAVRMKLRIVASCDPPLGADQSSGYAEFSRERK